jgi:hypothetical protein
MNRIAAAVAGVMSLISAAAGAQSLSGFGAPADPNAPKWLSTESQSGLYLGPNGFSQATRNETSVKLGSGLSVGLFSSSSTAPGGGSIMDPVGSWSTGYHGALHTGFGNTGFGDGLNPVAGNALTSTFGGRLSKDLGSGVSVSFVGGVTRDPAGGFYLGPRGALMNSGNMNSGNMNSSGALSTSMGGEMSMDLGGGSSFSVGASMSRSSSGAFTMGRCAGLTAGLCR